MDIKLRAGRYWKTAELTAVGERLLLRFDKDQALLNEVRCLEGRRWQPELNGWTFTDSPRNRFALRVLQGKGLELWTGPVTTVTPTRDCLYEHQVALLSEMYHRKRKIVAAEMGTGKTLAVIELMEKVGGRWWYVAPAGVLPAIERELRRWRCTNKPRLISYSKLWRILEDYSDDAPQGVVFDESSRIKNPTAKRTIAAQHLADAVREEHDGYVILLTGTPAPKEPTDWWSQCEVACPGFLRESSTTQLRYRLAEITNKYVMCPKHGQTWGGCCEGLEEHEAPFPKLVRWKMDEVAKLRRRMGNLTSVLFKKDCLDLPEKVYHVLEAKPDAATLRAAYFIAQTAPNAITALTRLRQLSDGFQYETDSEFACPKDGLLKTLLDQHEEVGRIVIYASFTASINRVVRLCQAQSWSTIRCDGQNKIQPEDLSRFQDGEGRVAFVAHPLSGGMGLTLTASPSVVYWSNDFNGESRIQSEDRIHRPGCTGAAIYDLVHLPTDRLVLDALRKRRSLQSLSLGEVINAISASGLD